MDDIFSNSQINLVQTTSFEGDTTGPRFDTGFLLGNVEVKKPIGMEKIIHYKSNYAAPVEFGRDPGGRMPPVNELIPWVKRKFGTRNDKHAKSIAWAIAKKIQKEGITQKAFMRLALDQVRFSRKQLRD